MLDSDIGASSPFLRIISLVRNHTLGGRPRNRRVELTPN